VIGHAHLQLESSRRVNSSDDSAPLIVRPETQLVLSADLRYTCGSLGPPSLKTFGRGNGRVDLLNGSRDSKIPQNVRHADLAECHSTSNPKLAISGGAQSARRLLVATYPRRNRSLQAA
jgi:hypothetical protein